jgi:poly(3-hydroxybutyrate) depolymerase
MTSILLSCYSDVFAAGMVASGGMYEAAADVNSGIQAALHGSDRDPKATGRDAYQCSGSARRLMPVLVFHGLEDPYVNARGGQQVVEQFAAMNDLADDGKDNGTIRTIAEEHTDAYTRTDYGFEGKVVIRHIVVTHMGHAWAGGDPNYAYADPKGPDETALMWQFFEQYRRR